MPAYAFRRYAGSKFPGGLGAGRIKSEAGRIKTVMCVLWYQNHLVFNRRPVEILTPGLRVLLSKFTQLFLRFQSGQYGRWVTVFVAEILIYSFRFGHFESP